MVFSLSFSHTSVNAFRQARHSKFGNAFFALQIDESIIFQGEALILHSKDWESEDMSEIAQRLKAVTSGAATQEFVLRRNQVGQLGFHVQHDGLITEVENFGYAWQSGLRQGSRLVEVKNAFILTILSLICQQQQGISFFFFGRSASTQ